MKEEIKEGCIWSVVGGCLAFFAFWGILVRITALAWR
jgi:hypothetical protein